MGLIRSGISAITGTLADQSLEAVVPMQMNNNTIMSIGVQKNSRNKGTDNVITDGSLIHVGENQMMLLVDGGKIIDYSAEPGYYEVSNTNAPSLFNGDFGGALSDAYNRFRFGGSTPYSQQVFYINTQEIQDVPFGTPNAINYFDDFYNAELYVRAHGYYSIRVVNPLKFYSEMGTRNANTMGVEDLRRLFLAEFLTAFQSSIGKMSVEGVRISHLSSKTMELAEYMSTILDEPWEERRGMKIESVGISSISYDDQSKELIDMRNKGAMLGDPNIRTGYVQGSTARGIEAAGSNSAGSMAGFMGVNMASNVGGGFVSAAGDINNQQPSAPVVAPSPTSTDNWTCGSCQHLNNGGKFCANCGTSRPTMNNCSECGSAITPGAKFCSNCGHQLS